MLHFRFELADSQGNLLSSLDALGQKVDLSYESKFDKLATLQDQRGNITGYTYTEKGDLSGITYVDGSTETYSYDAQGNVTVAVNRRGEKIEYTYDTKGLLLNKKYPDGTNATFTYDNRGNLLTAKDPDSNVSYTYDSADRLTKVTENNGRFLEFTYDAGGRRTKMLDQTGAVVNYTYDTAGRLSKLTNGSNDTIVTYAYDAAGRLLQENNGNGTYTKYTYDPAGQVTSIINYTTSNAVNSKYEYTYDNLGRRSSMTTLDGKTTYGYDATGQLTSVTLPTGRKIEYSYDAAGNRTTVVDNSAIADYSTNNLNQYTSVGTATYTYDKDGNLTSKTQGGNTSTYTYDVENRLTKVVSPDGTWTYEYDALGNRIASIKDGQRTEYLLDPTGLVDVVGEYNNTGSLVARYIHGLGLVSRTDGSNTNSYYDTDAIGSVVGLSGTTGSYLNRYSYLPFGEDLTKVETISNPFEYVGQFGVMDEGNGLDFMRARFYDSNLGRFTAIDPVGLRGGDTNLYRYVANNSISLIDPQGTIYVPIAIGVATGIGTYLISNPNPTSGGAFGAGLIGGIGGGLGVAANAAKLLSPTLGYQISIFSAGIGSLLLTALQFSENPNTSGLNAYTGLAQNFALGFLSNAANIFSSIVLRIQDSLVVLAFDPNDITGPAGFGDQNYITPDQVFPYTIRFENQASATAPAVFVTVTQQLDADLDLNTFELGDFGFGNIYIDVPAGLQAYSTRIDLTSTLGYFVDFNASVDPTTRNVTWKLTTTDPITGGLPSNPDAGFLPPNNANHDGEGFINYSVKPKADLPTGTAIDAKAKIIFDFNTPIDTPQWTNTIDVDAPTSKISTLPATTNMPNFTVAWTGSDSGSGVVSYDIYVSDTGSEFKIWKKATTDTSATYSGIIGHTYTFYSIATDGVGRTQTTPSAQISTQLIAANNAPSQLVLNPSQVAENVAIGSTFGKLTATDLDTGDTLTYSLTTGIGSTNNDLFEIVGDELKLKISPDYETKPNYSIRIKVSDQAGLSNEQTFTISIIDVNEPPTQLVINNNQLPENVPVNTVVGTLSATIPNGDTLTYSLVTGEGSTDNQFFEIVDNTIRIKITPDFEIKPNYTVRVKATNQNGLSTEKPFPINITNTNEAPTQVTITTNQITENSPINTIIGQLSTIDPDAGDSFTYSLVPNNLFSITGNQLKLIASPDYETKSSYQLQITSTDKAGLSINQPLTINITDVVEPNTLKNANDRTFQVTGDQGSKKLSFQITSQNLSEFTETGFFKVDDNLGTINGIKPEDSGYLAAALDRFQIISSLIPTVNLPQGFDGKTNRNLNLDYGDIVRFGLVNNRSIDELRQTPSAFGQLTLSEPTTLKITDTNGVLAINWQTRSSPSLTATLTNNPAITLGTTTQNNPQGELIDLRQTTKDVSATFSIYREAAYNNNIYFYAIQNETGSILDGTTTLKPTDSGYLQAALHNAIAEVNLSTPNQTTTTTTATLNKGLLLAPIIVVNSTKNALLDNNPFNDPAAYTPFILGNSDKVDHIRLLGDNTFGFEDLAGGGDMDYNDVIVKVNLQSIG
jgi:RHS repeat-associated protein